MSYTLIAGNLTSHFTRRLNALRNQERARWSTANVETWEAYWKSFGTEDDNSAAAAEYQKYITPEGDLAKLQGVGLQVAFGAAIRRDAALQFMALPETDPARFSFFRTLGMRLRLDRLSELISRKLEGFKKS